jgi:hypothetical protein
MVETRKKSISSVYSTTNCKEWRSSASLSVVVGMATKLELMENLVLILPYLNGHERYF